VKPSFGGVEQICDRGKPGILRHVARATYFWIETKTLFTLRSMTLANAFSGCSSNGAPHVAPALAKRMSTWSVCLLTAATSFSQSPGLARSAGTDMALPEKPGSLFNASHASSHALALREVMKIREQPAWARLDSQSKIMNQHRRNVPSCCM